MRLPRLVRSLWLPLRSPAPSAVTEALATISPDVVTRVLELAMRVGSSMLAVGASANDVMLATTRVAAAYGVRPLHATVTFNAITVSFHPLPSVDPVTLMRVVRPPVPDHTKLQRLQALVVEIEEGLPLDDAVQRCAAIRRLPFRLPPAFVIASQALLATGVAVFMGASWVIAIAAFVAAALAVLVQRLLARWRVPFFFTQIVAAFVVTLCAVAVAVLGDAGVELFQGVRISIVVAASIVLLLSGLSVVGAAQDAIEGFALTALGRIIELTLLTVGVVVGILVALEVASSLGVGVAAAFSAGAPPLGTPVEQAAGAVLIALSVALANGASLRAVLMSMLLGAIAWAVWHVTALAGFGGAISAGAGALAASFAGILVAHRLHVPSIAVTTAAIVPLVPGYTLFRGLLAFATATDQADVVVGIATLADAAGIGLGLASGATLGLFLGAPVRDRVQSVMRGGWRAR